MSWLRSRRRTLDIVNEVGEFDNYDRFNTDSLNTGVYSAQYDDRQVPACVEDFVTEECDNEQEKEAEENLNVTFKNIKINNNADGVNDDVSNDENNNGGGDNNNDDECDQVDENMVLQNDKINENILESLDGSADDVVLAQDIESLVISDDLIPLAVSGINYSSGNTGELMDDTVIEQEFKKSGCSKPRFSLDSQMAGLLKSPHVCRLTRLSESSISEDEDESISRITRPRKSISWAEDLETVHEFEKLKARRLSLANLFKKM